MVGMVIKSEYAHSLDPKFIRRVIAEGCVRTRDGYEYKRRTFGWIDGVYHIDIIRKEPLTNDEKIICYVEY